MAGGELLGAGGRTDFYLLHISHFRGSRCQLPTAMLLNALPMLI